jgi:hypothetical protein
MLPFPYTNALQSKQRADAHIASRSTIVRILSQFVIILHFLLKLYRLDKRLIYLLFNDVCIILRHLVTYSMTVEKRRTNELVYKLYVVIHTKRVIKQLLV